jgi:hypothetical protein
LCDVTHPISLAISLSGTLPLDEISFFTSFISTNVHVRALTLISGAVLVICCLAAIIGAREKPVEAVPDKVLEEVGPSCSTPLLDSMLYSFLRWLVARNGDSHAPVQRLLWRHPNACDPALLRAFHGLVSQLCCVSVLLRFTLHLPSLHAHRMSVCPLDCFFTTWIGQDRVIAGTGLRAGFGGLTLFSCVGFMTSLASERLNRWIGLDRLYLSAQVCVVQRCM